MVRKNYRIGPLSAYMLAHLQILTEHNQYYKYEFFFFLQIWTFLKKQKKNDLLYTNMLLFCRFFKIFIEWLSEAGLMFDQTKCISKDIDTWRLCSFISISQTNVLHSNTCAWSFSTAIQFYRNFCSWCSSYALIYHIVYPHSWFLYHYFKM